MLPASIVPVIGGGPAGMSCALWLKNYGLHPVIIEHGPTLGGMARRNPYPNPWLLGWPGAKAHEAAEAFARHIGEAGIEVWFNTAPQRLVREAGGFGLDVLGDEVPRSVSCRALVVATGTEFRGTEWLDLVPNARRFAEQGKLDIGPIPIGETPPPAGTHVALIGGGDNAFDVAHILLQRGVQATIVMRSKAPQAQPRLVARVEAQMRSGRAAVMAGRTVASLGEAAGRIDLRLDDGTGFEADRIALLFGYQPNTHQAWLADLALRQDDEGYLWVDGNLQTSCPGVFAVGDVANPAHPCVATAIAAGTMAAREIARQFG
jgi:thioredoxin reductase (NADPH)